MVRRFAFVWFLVFVASVMLACSTLQTTSTSTVVTEAARTAGTVGYLYVPDARAYLAGICSLDYSDNATLQGQFVELLGAAWVKSSSQTDSKLASLVVVQINRLVGLLGINEAEIVPLQTAKSVVASVCVGVNDARSILGM